MAESSHEPTRKATSWAHPLWTGPWALRPCCVLRRENGETRKEYGQMWTRPMGEVVITGPRVPTP